MKTARRRNRAGNFRAMLAHHCKRLFTSREFGITLLLSLLFSAYLGYVQLSELKGGYLETISPNWWYVCFYHVGDVIKNTYPVFVLLAVPFIGSLVYGGFFYDDRAAKRDALLVTRSGGTAYWLSGGIAAFLGGFLICFAFELLWRGMLTVGIPGNAPKHILDTVHVGDAASWNLFPRLLLTAPWLYALLYSVLPSLYSGLLAVATLGCTLLFPKQKKFFHVLAPGLCVLGLSVVANMTVRLLKLPIRIPEVHALMVQGAPGFPEYRPWMLFFYIALAVIDGGMLFFGIRKNRDLL